MHHPVERDEQGRSNYAMCAVNPSRVGKTLDDTALREIVNTIANGRDCLGLSTAQLMTLGDSALHGYCSCCNTKIMYHCNIKSDNIRKVPKL